MKKIRIILTVSIVLLSTIACENYLEQKTYSDLSTTNFYQNPGDAVAGIYAAYSQLNFTFGARWHFVVEYLGPDVTTAQSSTSNYGLLDVYHHTPSSAYIADAYSSCWRPILNANTVLDNIDNIPDMDETDRAMIKGEARFIRSLAYFALVRLWQHVPLITSSMIDLNNLDVAKSDASVVNEFIVDDLNQAISELPLNAPEFGRASKGSAQALLAKVLITRANVGFSPDENGDYTTAAQLLKEIINSSVYDLNPNLRDVWGLYSWPDYENDNEFIFTIQCMSGGAQNNNVMYHVLPLELSSRAWQTVHGEAPFYMEFDDDDVRRQVFYVEEFVKGNDTLRFNINNMHNDDFNRDGPALARYVDLYDTGGGIGRDNARLTFADVLLLYAEAILERDGEPNAEATNAINMIRRRAHDYAVNQVSPFDLVEEMSYEDFRKELYMERRKEFLFSGNSYVDGLRFWDLFKEAVESSSRYVFEGQPDLSNAIPKLPITVEEKHKVLPIPVRAMDNNHLLEQHELWK